MTKEKFFTIMFRLYLILAIIFVVKFRIVCVNGQSMYPTLHDKQICLMLNTTNINDGDIVIIDTKNSGLPADYIIKRFYADKSTDDYIWVEGDNKNNSLDSRRFGHLDRHKVIGKLILWGH